MKAVENNLQACNLSRKSSEITAIFVKVRICTALVKCLCKVYN